MPTKADPLQRRTLSKVSVPTENSALGRTGKPRKSFKDKGRSVKGIKREHDERQIYVSGLPYKMSDDDIKQLFSSCGAIKSMHFPLNRQGKPAGFGFIVFESTDAIPQALAFDAQEIHGRFIQVEQLSTHSD